MIQDYLVILRAKLLRKLRKSGAWPRANSSDFHQALLPSGLLAYFKKLPASTLPKTVLARFIRGDILVFGGHWVAREELHWSKDFLSGFSWSQEERSEKISIEGAVGADIKVPWELARFQHWPQVALSFISKSHDRAVLKEAEQAFENQIGRFISENKYGFGVHWWSAMEVSIRAINIAIAYEVFRSLGCGFSKEFEKSLGSFLRNSNQFIKDNLEWYRRGRSNHYLVNLLGLQFLARILGQPNNFANRRLQKEILRQFLGDGGCFESSTYYHRFSLEAAALAIPLFGPPISDLVKNRIGLALNFIKCMRAPDGTLPQIGDNDSGRIMKFSPDYYGVNEGFENLRNVEDSIGLIEAFFVDKGKPHNLNLGTVISIEKEFGKPNSVREYRIALSDISNMVLHVFPDFGVYAWRGSNFFASIRCGKNLEELNGAHAHFDQLSFTLWHDGDWKIEDPGSFVYKSDSQKRNIFRGPKAHHMPKLNVNDFRADDHLDSFIHKNLPSGLALRVFDNEFYGSYEFAGRKFTRKINFKANEIVIRDELYGDGTLLDLSCAERVTSWGYREETRGVL